MWCTLSLAALAGDAEVVDKDLSSDAPREAIVPFDVETLPWQIQDEQRWARVHFDATYAAKLGGAASVASGMVVMGGATMLFIALDGRVDKLTVPAIGVTVIGAAGAVAAPPVLLAGGLRAARALRERGVYVTTTPAITGFTLYGLSLLAMPFFVSSWPVAPVYYAAIVGCGFAQLEVNRVSRRHARLPLQIAPEPRGLSLRGIF